jgi:hypothetical protein
LTYYFFTVTHNYSSFVLAILSDSKVLTTSFPDVPTSELSFGKTDEILYVGGGPSLVYCYGIELPPVDAATWAPTSLPLSARPSPSETAAPSNEVSKELTAVPSTETAAPSGEVSKELTAVPTTVPVPEDSIPPTLPPTFAPSSVTSSAAISNPSFVFLLSTVTALLVPLSS